MIAKITNGARFGALAAYLHGPGRANEHLYDGQVGGAVIGGNLAAEGDRDGAGWAALLRQAAAVRPDIERAVWHASLRNAPTDRVLTDAEWAMAGQDFAEAMGFENQPWVMVRHGVDHVHLVASRVNYDGQVWSRRNDRYKAQRACTAIEADLGLSATPRQSTVTSYRGADHQVTSGEWRRGLREQAAPSRVALAESVTEAALAAQGGGRAGFEVALAAAGVEYRANIASTGKVSGYRFHLPGHNDGAGEPVWFRASQLDKKLAWSRLAPFLEGPPPALEAPVASRGWLESRKHHAGRLAAAQAAEAKVRTAAVPRGAARQVAAHHAWWAGRATQHQEEAAARALARQRVALEARQRPSMVAARSFPTLTPQARADLQRSIEQATKSTARRRTRPPGPEHGPSLGR